MKRLLCLENLMFRITQSHVEWVSSEWRGNLFNWLVTRGRSPSSHPLWRSTKLVLSRSREPRPRPYRAVFENRAVNLKGGNISLRPLLPTFWVSLSYHKPSCKCIFPASLIGFFFVVLFSYWLDIRNSVCRRTRRRQHVSLHGSGGSHKDPKSVQKNTSHLFVTWVHKTWSVDPSFDLLSNFTCMADVLLWSNQVITGWEDV